MTGLRVVRLLGVAVLVATSITGVLIIDPPAAAALQSFTCNEDSLFGAVDCDRFVTTYVDSGGESVAVECDPDDGQACWVQDCSTFVSDDASRFGMVWSGSEFDRPLFTGGGHTFDGLTPTNLSYYEALFDGAGSVGGVGSGNQFSETGAWWACTAVDAELDVAVQLSPGNAGAVTYGPSGGLIDVVGIRDWARAAALPAVPPIDKSTADGVASIVQVPTWFWIEPGYWVDGQASRASSSGRLRVTVFAEPLDTVWETGEGTLRHCEDGHPYLRGTSDPDDPSACSWIYRNSTGWHGGPYTVEATAHWFLRWEMSFNTGFVTGREPLGPDPDYYTSDSWDIEVEEVLAVGSAGGEPECSFLEC